ncbi:MAG: hypothetical protein CSB33_01655 [Desulfobacterales bacterium]|nr:MAG: hypothetical protein CSB33_01655 [Desulfobacterales bacterium]
MLTRQIRIWGLICFCMIGISSGAMAGSDDDGLSDIQEARYQTDARLPDTDGGGASDGEEVASGTDPLNPDDDDGGIQTVHISLTEGLNLISLPVMPENTSVEGMLADIGRQMDSIWLYNGPGDWNSYSTDPKESNFNDLHEMIPGKGYWLRMAAPAVLTVRGHAIAGAAVSLKSGMNAAGHSHLASWHIQDIMDAIDGTVNTIWEYDAASHQWKAYNTKDSRFNNLELIQPGKGYFLDMDTAGEIRY